MTESAYRILMADDHPIVLAGLKSLVATDTTLQVVGQAQDGATALRLARTLQPDAILLDISMPELNGVDVAIALRKDVPNCRILILTVHEDQAYLRQLLEIGVAGYLLKRSAPEELIRAIRTVLQSGTYIDPAIAGKLIGAARRHPNQADGASDVELSQREADVVRLLATGHTNKEVAEHLGISSKTIETYKVRAMEKLGLKTRVDIVRYAGRQGWFLDVSGNG